MKDVQTRAKTSLASTSATVTIGPISASASETTMTILNSPIDGDYQRTNTLQHILVLPRMARDSGELESPLIL